MQLDSCFGGAKLGPREQRQAQVDGGGIQGVDGFGEIDGKRVLGIQAPRAADKHLREIAIDPPVARLVGIRQGAAPHVAAKTDVIQFVGCERRQASMSRRLSRYVNCAKAIDRNWSRQLKVRTLKSPRYFATRRRKVCHGANSMSCENTVLPMCIGASLEAPKDCRHGQPEFKSLTPRNVMNSAQYLAFYRTDLKLPDWERSNEHSTSSYVSVSIIICSTLFMHSPKSATAAIKARL